MLDVVAAITFQATNANIYIYIYIYIIIIKKLHETLTQSAQQSFGLKPERCLCSVTRQGERHFREL